MTPLRTTMTSEQFQPTRWALIAAGICALPLLLLLVGVDFSSGRPPLTAADTAGHTPAEIGELAHHALHGSFTHTLLEWSALCMAFFVGAMAFLQFRLTREPSLPIIGAALVCAGAMDGFHTFAADRLIDAVADNRQRVSDR